MELFAEQTGQVGAEVDRMRLHLISAGRLFGMARSRNGGSSVDWL